MKYNKRCPYHCVYVYYINVGIIVTLSYLLGSKVQVQASSAAGQETLIGLVGKDFLVIGADSSLSSSIAITSNTVDKIRFISNPFPFGIPKRYRRGRISIGDGDSNDAGVEDGDADREHKDRFSFHRQQIIAVASAGELPDCERLISQLSNHVTQMEYEDGIGCDVNHIFHQSKDYNIKTNTGIGGIDLGQGLDAEQVAHLARDHIAKAMRSRDRMSACLLIGGMVPVSASASDQVESGGDKLGAESYADRIQAQVTKATASLVSTGSNTARDTGAEDEDDIESESETMEGRADYEPKLFWLDEYGSLQNLQYGSHGMGSNFVLSILDRGYDKNLTREEAVVLLQDCFRQLRKRYVVNSPEPPCIKCIDCSGYQQYF